MGTGCARRRRGLDRYPRYFGGASPHSATVQTAVEFKSAELVWDLNQIPAEGVFQGTYTLTASLADTPEGPYALVDGVPAMEVLVVLGGGEAYAQSTPFNVALNEWEWEGFDSGATAVLAINKDNIQTVQDLIAAIRLSAPKRIYGWATGDKSVNDGAYTYADKQERIVVKNADGKGNDQEMLCSWGYLDVSWSNLETTITCLPDLNSEFTIYAPIPTCDGRKYFVNEIGRASCRERV